MIDDLKKYKVGVTIGYKNQELYKEKGIKAQAVNKEELNFNKMLAGRIDVYQTSKIVGYFTIHKLFTPEKASLFTNHPKIFEINKYHVLFSKNPSGKFYSEKLDLGIIKLKNTRKYDEILSNL